MSSWKIKSDENLVCGETLIKEGKPSASIHCLYYSNIQLILHILNFHFNKSENQIENERKAASRKRITYHNWIINYMVNEIARKGSKSDAAVFNDYIQQLKELRVTADYKNRLISKNEAQLAMLVCNNISTILKEKFRI